jgi:hypothetical protein
MKFRCLIGKKKFSRVNREADFMTVLNKEFSREIPSGVRAHILSTEHSLGISLENSLFDFWRDKERLLSFLSHILIDFWRDKE